MQELSCEPLQTKRDISIPNASRECLSSNKSMLHTPRLSNVVVDQHQLQNTPDLGVSRLFHLQHCQKYVYDPLTTEGCKSYLGKKAMNDNSFGTMPRNPRCMSNAHDVVAVFMCSQPPGYISQYRRFTDPLKHVHFNATHIVLK